MAQGRVQARGGCGVVPSVADPFALVPGGGEAASLATDVGSYLHITMTTPDVGNS